jgi:anti-sigma B factor antagonist
MNEPLGSSSPSGRTSEPALLIRLNPRFGGGRAVVCHLDEQGRETEIAQFLSGGHPAAALPDISELIRREIAGGRGRVIIDLVHVPWLNSNGIGYLVALWTTVTRAGGRPRVVNVSARLLELMKLMKLDEVFSFAPSIEDAR